MNPSRSMSRRLAAMLFGATILAAAMPSAYALDPGQSLPIASVAGSDANTVPLVDGKARATYIDFWASWCGPCRQSFPWMNRMQDKFGAKGLRIVAVNLDTKRADAQAFLAQLPAKFDLGFDNGGAVARQFGIRTMPSSVLVGADGKVIAVHHGFREEAEAELEQRIAEALARP
jgi:cytochrome c biogenesis protein CcmG/thiol:disulfide interchange protein DsbE